MARNNARDSRRSRKELEALIRQRAQKLVNLHLAMGPIGESQEQYDKHIADLRRVVRNPNDPAKALVASGAVVSGGRLKLRFK